MDPAAFKDAMSRWASGVAVVTTNHDGLLYGLTVSSLISVSLEPPLVLVSLHNESRLIAMLEASGRFAVSLLGEDQEAASRYFSSPGREPTEGFVEIPGDWTELGQPFVAGALAHVVCRRHRAIVAGDHTLVLGEVVHASAEAARSPLLYFHRGYRRLAD